MKLSAIIKRYVLFAIVSILVCTIESATANADIDYLFGVDMDFRYRSELDSRDLKEIQENGRYDMLRFRLGTWIEHKNLKSYFQIQYPHRIGWNSATNKGDSTLQIHQANLNIYNVWKPGLNLQLGRMPLSYGDERFIGSSDWTIQGRTFDGIKVNYIMEQYSIDYFWTVQQANFKSNSALQTTDDQFIGVWGKHRDLNLNLFALKNYEKGLNTSNNSYLTTLDRNTFGLHYHRRYDSGFGSKLNFAYQTGYSRDTTTWFSRDISAMMLGFDASYELELEHSIRFTLGFDWTSGDDSDTFDKLEGYNNLYFTGHRYNGYMDYFTRNVPNGLRDIYFKSRLRSGNTFGLLFALHYFEHDKEYVSKKDSTTTKKVGNEFNLEGFYKFDNSVQLISGFGYFIPSQHWQGEKASNGFWGHISLLLNFNAQLKFN